MTVLQKLKVKLFKTCKSTGHFSYFQLYKVSTAPNLMKLIHITQLN